MYPTIKIDKNKTSNKLGSLISMYLQNIENDILMIMVNKCKELNISIDVSNITITYISCIII
jgi:hypothetical protein